MTSGWSVNSSIPIQRTSAGAYKTFTIVYFVFEKKWPLCALYPPNNAVTFYDILCPLPSLLTLLSSFLSLSLSLSPLPSPLSPLPSPLSPLPSPLSPLPSPLPSPPLPSPLSSPSPFSLLFPLSRSYLVILF